MLSRIKKAIVSLLNDDTSDYPTTQVSYNGIAQDTYRFSPYGLSSHPPIGSLSILLSAHNHGDDPLALISSPRDRFKELKEGEVEIGNHIKKSSIKFNTDGGIEIDTAPDGDLVITVPTGDAQIEVTGDIAIDVVGGQVDLTAPTVNVTGAVNVTGDLAVTGTISATVDVQGGPLSTSLVTHVHGGVTSGGSSTGPPV